VERVIILVVGRILALGPGIVIHLGIG